MNAFIARKSHKLESESGMHATARDYALKYRAPLGRYGKGFGAREGYYYLAGPDSPSLAPKSISMQPTAKSAIAMMKRAGFR